ncbi:DUF2203 domain-containing protein [Paenibacillus doosanensis]|uniref:Cell division protein DivIVA n=1 Tax=Paenibacillus konkukensis TaxID=2020716 RepID=A0ABY4RWL8_9BACL|nr:MULTISPECIES: DUF2203 domain-containing protein [Paenibacillus]MCS7460753.1 DUF2203 domain-containing protein [Paenibacillus doosanensis]UQZ85933.1 hypothetical protein SK3146_05223 [Paenibacillus konkukensis]
MAKTYFTLAEANAMLPLVKQELAKLQDIKRRFREKYEELHQLKAYHKQKGGASQVDPYFTLECEMDFLQVEGNAVMQSFELNGIQLKDVDMGLVDFPALLNGEEVLLCWRQGEESVQHYHGLYDGYAGRKKLTGE